MRVCQKQSQFNCLFAPIHKIDPVSLRSIAKKKVLCHRLRQRVVRAQRPVVSVKVSSTKFIAIYLEHHLNFETKLRKALYE